MRILVTGTAGFIGHHLTLRLLADGHRVVGVDAMTPYYDVTLKQRRLELQRARPGFSFHEVRLEDAEAFAAVWAEAEPEIAVHLAAQAGVRYSLESPRTYVDANVGGTFNVLELARRRPLRHLLVASTSSVYGLTRRAAPARETDATDQPVSLYAATKKAAEAMGHSYAHLFGIPTTFLRFFTVYGPWGRPDMAFFKFTAAILEGRPIDLYAGGRLTRDFTYVGDIVEAVSRLLEIAPSLDARVGGDSLSTCAPFRVVNIGAGAAASVSDFLAAIERACGREALRNDLPMQPGDVAHTLASTELLHALTGFRPTTALATGVDRFVAWYRGYYGV
jgi:UDP-glucuronate 4-epimerase